MKIRPLNDRVVVVGIEEKEKTTGGIIIPDTAKEKPQEGKVVEVGPGKWDENRKRIPLEIKKDDRVLLVNIREMKSRSMGWNISL